MFEGWKERFYKDTPALVPLTIKTGWHVRDDGDIETADGVIPLVEFAASGHIESVQLKMALEIKAKHEKSTTA